MAVTDQPDKSWGDAACPGPVGDKLVSHGESLAKRKDGKWALYVVNHGGRQSIEMYELKRAGDSWSLVWHGCEVAAHDYNDVAILPDGGFVGTIRRASTQAAPVDPSAAKSPAMSHAGRPARASPRLRAHACVIPTAWW